MADTSGFSQKIDELQNRLDQASGKAAGKEKCAPTTLIAGVATPVVVWLILYFLQPKFVQKKEGNKYIRNNMKLLTWTVGITIVLWVIMYMFVYFQGYKSSMTCTRW